MRFRSTALSCSLLLAPLLVTLSGQAAAAGGSGPSGRWQGAIVTAPGEHEVDIVVDFVPGKDGSWSGVMSVPTQAVKNKSLESIQVEDGRTVSWVYRDQSGPAVLTGTIAQDGQTMTGLDQEGKRSYPFKLVRIEGAGRPAPPLGDLPSVESFREVFNRDQGKTRLVLVLAPSCGLCEEGARMVQRYVLDKHPDESLAVYVIWVPISKLDDRQVAQEATSHLTDPRAEHFWNGDLSIANAFKAPLGVEKGPAWDVYIVYGPGKRWEGAAPAPEGFMHRLGKELPSERRFNALLLEKEIQLVLLSRAR